MVAFVVGGSNIFAIRMNKQYNLIADDPFFHESFLKWDQQKIRMTKLFTILSGAILKIIICFATLFYYGIYEKFTLISLAIMMLLGSVIEFINVYQNKLFVTIVNKIFIYIAIFIFGFTTLFNIHSIFLWLYLFALFIYSLIFTIKILRKNSLKGEFQNG